MAVDDELSPYRLDRQIIMETAERLIADFALFDITILFSGSENANFSELMDQLIPEVDALSRANSAKLMQIIYRIDISEQKLVSALAANPELPWPEVVSRLLIEREMQKVITRRYFKGKT